MYFLWKPVIEVPAGLASPEACGFPPSHHVLMWPLLCVCGPGVSPRFDKDTSRIGLGPYHYFILYGWAMFHCVCVCVCVYIYIYIKSHIFFIHSYVNRHLGCFHVLVIVNSVAPIKIDKFILKKIKTQKKNFFSKILSEIKSQM